MFGLQNYIMLYYTYLYLISKFEILCSMFISVLKLCSVHKIIIPIYTYTFEIIIIITHKWTTLKMVSYVILYYYINEI